MKSLTLILSLLSITYSLSKDIVYGLTDCKVENHSTIKTTAVITCTANATLAQHTFKDDYLKLQDSATGNTTKTATLATCTNECTSSSGITCTITCTKVTGAEAGGLYILSPISAAASQMFLVVKQMQHMVLY